MMSGKFSRKLKLFITLLVLIAGILSGVIVIQSNGSLAWKLPSSPPPHASVLSLPTFSPIARLSTPPATSSAVLGDSSREKATVKRVVDGDTIELTDGRKVRYIGIDTPETVKPNAPVECFGKEASEKNKELVLGKEIEMAKDVSETDRYGRLLRFVYVGDVFVNDLLVREGYAYASTYPPDVKYSAQFKDAQRDAETHRAGLWAASCPLHKGDAV